MVSIKEIAEYLSAHQLLNLKVAEAKLSRGAESAGSRGPYSDINSSNFPDMSDIYSSTPCSFLATTKNDDNKGDNITLKTTTARTACELLGEFGQSTSMHGLSHATGDKLLWRRLLWAVLVICFSIWATYNVTQIISDFRQNPVITSVSSEYQGKVTFPAVTICNLNRIRQSVVPQLVEGLVYVYLSLGAGVDQINTYINLVMRNYPADYQREIGHQIDRMLIGSTLPHLRIPPPAPPPPRSLKQAGPQHGLSLELDIEYEEYLTSSPAAGVKIIVHENAEVPFPEDGGVVARTGAHTNIGIRKTHIKRLPQPHGDCIKQVDSTNTNKNLFSEKGFSYSLHACLKSCFQESVYKECSCCDPSYPCISDALQLSTGIPASSGVIQYCNVTAPDTGLCVGSVAERFADNSLGCSQICPPSCEESTYSTTVSSGKWPTDRYFATVLHNQGVSDHIVELMQRAEYSLLKLSVYFDSLIVEKVESQPAYSWNRLLGEIGGQLGLLLGFSILTAVEIIELLLLDLGFGLGLKALWRRQHVTNRIRDKVKMAWD
ncbi:hypothetical protein EGW08_017300 [Elysia chlorotica]|uniref:Uncharacterized protein n=1 Tax=Elysia chlorotica TaxID=188477 RepID=A0A433T088_ELYCH|nr:hypothetical protein EGW08_017300 [Elysia chlorotica]